MPGRDVAGARPDLGILLDDASVEWDASEWLQQLVDDRLPLSVTPITS